ncbi:replication initiator [Actinopolyspora mortivallis]|nr:replication initiator [Actinopolyspora mortivallis]
MVLPVSLDVDRLTRRMQRADFETWKAKVRSVAGCTRPVHLSGRWAIHDTATGNTLRSRSGEIMTPCGNRREAVCPACSDRYAADAFHLMRAGLSGGSKGVPEAVAEAPRVFATLTAPSFGPVHNRRVSRNGKTMPCACGSIHHEHDPARGQPLDPDTYDYTGHVLWNAHAGVLWTRFRTYLLRHLAGLAGLRVREIGHHLRLSYAKVAEYQKRGVIHFHAVIRLDGPQGPAEPPPAWASTDLLSEAVRTAARAVSVTAPDLDGHRRLLRWGEQLDIRPITAANASQLETEHGEITEDRLASYVAKYATKGTSTNEAVDRPIRSRGHIDLLDISPHHRRIIHTAWDLGAPVACPDCSTTGHCRTCGGSGWVSRTLRAQHRGELTAEQVDPVDALKLRRWAHMLAFRGHFLSKSQHYSTTFTRIRGDRRQYRHHQVLDELGVTEDEITVINHWALTHVGHDSPEETELAEALAHQIRRDRQQRYEHEKRRN